MRVADGEWLRWKTGPFDLADPVATCNLASLAGETQDLWYAYDDMNRQVMVEGAVNGNAADTNNLTTAQGHVVTYDKNGNRTSDTFQGTQLVAQVGADGTTRYVVHQGRITVYYRYDAAGRLSETAIGAIDAQGNALDESRATVVSQNYYDAAGHLIQSGGGDKLPAGYVQAAANNPDAAFNTDRTVREYDADGRLQRERITDRAGVLVQDTNYAGGYDAVGNVLSYTITDGSGNVSRTTVTEIKGEEYKRSSVTTTKTAPSGVSVSASTRYAYDVNGELVRTDTTSAMGAVSTIKQTNDFDGNILQTIDGNEAWNRLVVDGQVYAVWDPPTGDTQAVVDAITAMYWELLDREPDAEGLAWWVHTVVEDGYSLQSVYDGIMASDEYKKLHSGDGSGGGDPAPDPGPTAADLVTQAYQALLGRTPSSQELQYWTGAMANGMSIFDVEAQMQSSPEYENRQVTSPDPGNFAPNGDLIVSYRPGDTLQGLALAAYGDASLAYLIARANGITAGSQLASLKEVVIPKASPVVSIGTMQGGAADRGKPTQAAFTVVQYKPGDTVQSLAEQAYGDSGYWELIAKQNNITWYDDLSKVGSITIPDLSVLQQAGGRAETFLNQLQARGFNMLSNGTIVDPGRASGPSQGALDYAREMALSNFDSNAASNVQTSATNSARASAALYLLSHPDATDRQLASEYLSQYNYVYDDGMSTLAQQVGASYAGDRFSDFMAMESGGFANDGPDFGRSDQFAAEMQGKTDALYRGNPGSTANIDALFPNVNSVSDLTADDLGPQKVDTASLTDLTGIAGPSPLDTGNGLGSTTMAGAGTSVDFAGWSEGSILGYITLHVPSININSSIPTERYVTAFDIYQRVQNGENQPGWTGMDYNGIVNKLNGFYLNHTPNPLELPGTTSFTYLRMPPLAADGKNLSDEASESNRSSAPTPKGGSSDETVPSFSKDVADRKAANPLTAAMSGSDSSGGYSTTHDGVDQTSAPSSPSASQPIYSTSSGTDRAPAQILLDTTPAIVSKDKSYDYQTVQTLADGTQQVTRVVHISLDDKAINAVNDWLQSDHEFAVGGGIYAGVGGEAEATIQVNISKGEIGVSQLEVGLGIGAGGSVHGGAIHPEGTPNHPDGGGSLSVSLFEGGIGDKQTDHTIAISTKAGIEASAPFVQFSADAKAGVQSQIGGGMNSTFMGLNWSGKLLPQIGLSAMAKWNVYNWNYKR